MKLKATDSREISVVRTSAAASLRSRSFSATCRRVTGNRSRAFFRGRISSITELSSTTSDLNSPSS
jgi:hypothetical protein